MKDTSTKQGLLAKLQNWVLSKIPTGHQSEKGFRFGSEPLPKDQIAALHRMHHGH